MSPRAHQRQVGSRLMHSLIYNGVFFVYRSRSNNVFEIYVHAKALIQQIPSPWKRRKLGLNGWEGRNLTSRNMLYDGIKVQC